MYYRLDYMLSVGSFEHFEGTMEKEDFAANVVATSLSKENRYDILQSLETLEEGIKLAIVDDKLGGEDPDIIRFFVIPNFNELGTELCTVAKISDSGQTFLFSSNEKFLKFYKDNNLTFGDIEEVFLNG